MSDDVTVVIPVYNNQGTINRALASVYSQTKAPAEIIVIDDCSSGGYAEIFSDWECRFSSVGIKFMSIRLGNNSGPSKARNIGWNAATSNYVAFLDADDSWLRQKLQLQVESMLVNNFDVVGCFSGEATKQKSASPYGNSSNFLTFKNILLRNPYTTCSTVLLRSSLPYRFDETMRYSEDYDLWLRMSASGMKFGIVNDKLSEYHKAVYGEAGLSADIFLMQFHELSCFNRLRHDGSIGRASYLFLISFSLVKFLKRVSLNGISKFYR